MDEEHGFDHFYEERDEIGNPNVQAFFQGLSRFNNFMDKVFSMPMDLTQKVLNLIQYITQASPTLCASCVCLTMTATLSVTSIAAGVGLGIGVGCLQPHAQNYITATTNTTTSTVSSITRYATALVSGTLNDGSIDAASQTNLARAIASAQNLPSGSVTVTSGVVSSNGGRRKRRGLLSRFERQVIKTLTFSYVYNLIICGTSCTSAVLATTTLTLTQVTLTVGSTTVTIATLTISISTTTITAGPTVATTSTTVSTASTSTTASQTTPSVG